jgi:iron complex outermembrane recepter protein
VRTQVRHIGGLEPLAAIAATTPVVADSVTYVDFATTVQVGESVELFGGIDNAFDEQPPLLTSSWGGDANTDVTLYDVIGRRYFVGVRARF